MARRIEMKPIRPEQPEVPAVAVRKSEEHGAVVLDEFGAAAEQGAGVGNMLDRVPQRDQVEAFGLEIAPSGRFFLNLPPRPLDRPPRPFLRAPTPQESQPRRAIA